MTAPLLHSARGLVEAVAFVRLSLGRAEVVSSPNLGPRIGGGVGGGGGGVGHVRGKGRSVRTLNRTNATASTKPRTLQEGIAELYDESSGIWEEVWGDHMHHGFYDPDSSASLSASDHRVYFQVADALDQPFPDGQFDLVWSVENGEHMSDKAKFVNELVRVAAPEATIIIVTWCNRDLAPAEESLQPWEKNLLNRICDAYYLPEWCSTADYVKFLESHSVQEIKRADWSLYVARFWPAVIRSALTWKGLTSLLRGGMKTIKGALVMPLMIEGFQKGVIKLAIITCRKLD